MNEGPSPSIPGFEIETEIGRGATGRVFAARQIALDRRVAIKIITTQGAKGQRRALRLFREARLAGALDHPGVVRGIDAGQGPGFVWFAMEFVLGRNLEEHLLRSGPLPLWRVLQIATEALLALTHVHGRGVVHRDLKPSNILIDEEGHVRLLDLGLARREVDPKLTDDSLSLGTPLYMSPEQARNPESVDFRSDLFSLGATLYRALCGMAPFEASSVSAVLTRLLYENPDPPSAHVRGLAPSVDLVFERALQKERHRRYQRASEFLDDIQALKRGTPISNRTLARKVKRSWRKEATLAFVLMAGGGGYLAWRALRTGDQPETPQRLELDRDSKTALKLAFEKALRVPESASLPELARALESSSRFGRDLGDMVTRDQADSISVLIDRMNAGISKLAANSLSDSEASHGDDLEDAGARSRARFERDLRQLLGNLDHLPAEVAHHAEKEFREVKRLADEKAESVRVATLTRLLAALTEFGAKDDSTIPREDLEKEADLILESAGGIRRLDSARRTRVRTERDAAVLARLRGPEQRWKAVLSEVEILRERGFLKSARERLHAEAERHKSAVPASGLEAERLDSELKAIGLRELSRAQEIVRNLGRPGLAAMAPEALKASILEFDRLVSEMSGREDEVEGLRHLLVQGTALRDVLEKGGSLRERLRGLVKGKVAEHPPMALGLRKGPRTSERRIVGVTDADELKTIRVSDGSGYNYALSELDATTVASLVRVLGGDVTSHESVALAYLEGNDTLAFALLDVAKDDGSESRSMLLERVQRALGERRKSLETDAEKASLQDLTAARRVILAGRYSDALPILDQALRRKPKIAAASAGLFDELKDLRASVVLEIEGAADRKLFGPLIDGDLESDAETGWVEMRWPLFSGRGLAAFGVPPGATPNERGLSVPSGSESKMKAPNEADAVKLELPGLEASELEISFDFTPGPGAPSTYFGLESNDFAFLSIGSVADHSPFLGQPLHGLEHGLRERRTVGRGALWRGTLAGYRAEFKMDGPKITLNPGETVRVRLRIEEKGKSATLMIGSSTFSVAKQVPRKSLEGQFRLVAWPEFEVSHVALRFRRPASGEAGRK